MKRRILFVDDEPLTLQALQRQLRTKREEWDMEFVDSGAKALDRLAASSFDVVVADMLMPGMSGAELLGETQRRHPQTARLILSGHADQQSILKCVPHAHQYLAKPCEPEDLRSVIARVTTPGFHQQNETIRALVSQIGHLPSLPTLYLELLKLLREPNVSMEEVGTVVAKDIAMTAQILKLVNSSFFGLSRQIADPIEAASYLGIETLKSLVLTTDVFAQFEKAACKTVRVDALWKHSLRVAAFAKHFAQIENAGTKVINESFVAGMLHDIGRLILAVNLPEKLEQTVELIQSMGIDPLGAEREIFGCTHDDLGGFLLGLWGLPVTVVEAIALHHRPSQSQNQTFSALTAVHVADASVREPNPILSFLRTPQFDHQYLAEMGLDSRLPSEREMEEAWAENKA